MTIAESLFAPFLASYRLTTRRVDAGARMAKAWRIITTRRHLREMDDRMLKDIGVSRTQANYEAARPVWDAFR
jgi:uncharacterized protein YjiS (DUF1127 family)